MHQAYMLRIAADDAGKQAAPTRFLLMRDGPLDWAGEEYKDFNLDAESAAATIAVFQAQGNQLPVDYHHQTLQVEQGRTGKAPASGWIRRLEYVPGEGLYAADVEWTEPAKAEIETRAYKYISPVADFDTTTGKPVSLHSVALTNTPRTRGLTELLKAADLAAGSEETMADKTKPTDAQKAAADAWKTLTGATVRVAAQEEMEGMGMSVTPEQALMVKLAEALGLENPTLTDLLQAALDKIGAGEEGETEAAEEAAAALGLDKKAGIKRIAAAVLTLTKKGATLKAQAAQFGDVAERLKTAEAKIAEHETIRVAAAREAAINEMIDAGKLNPNAKEAVKATGTLYDNIGPEGFEKYAAEMPVIIEPGRVSAVGGGNKRATLIAAASKEFDANPKVAFGGDKPSYITASLQDEGLDGKLTAVELTTAKGGAE